MPERGVPDRILLVDLESGHVQEDRVDEQTAAAFLGGRGIAAALLAERGIWRNPATAPESTIVIASGLLSGSPWPAASRVHFGFRSPLTGIYGYANAGGALGPRLASLGILAVMVSGRAPRPSVLTLSSGGVSLDTAGDLWGRGVSQTEAALQRGRTDVSVAAIGPAGENLVPLAAILTDGGRAAARCGGGAALGAKNLKAVVVEGEERPTYGTEFLDLARAATRRILTTPGVRDLSRWGTPILVGIKNETGDLPTKNHRLGGVPFGDRIDADAFEPYRVETKGCFGCPIRCGRISEVAEGVHRCRSAGPEYETIDALAANCFCAEPEVLLHANALCNDLGLDTISTGGVIAFAMECHEQGLLDEDGLDLSWGRGRTLIELVGRIARREGLGAILGQGVRAAAEVLGPATVPYALHVKGLEIPGQEPRAAKAFGLGHATSNRGADHLYALPTFEVAGLDDAARRLLPGLYPTVLDRRDESTKAELVVFTEAYCAISDALGVCKFTTTEFYALDPEHLANALRALGWTTDAERLLEAGERIVNLERLINVRLGIRAASDRLPTRFLDEPLGPSTGGDEERIGSFDRMLSAYYRLRGWSEDGVPSDETVVRLGLAQWRDLP
jgi:aldehyde:ferredoxin oxidoreductase